MVDGAAGAADATSKKAEQLAMATSQTAHEVAGVVSEAAEVLDIPAGTLTSRLVRGRMALQAQLAGMGA